MREIKWSDFWIGVWLVFLAAYLGFMGILYQMQQINILKKFSFLFGLILLIYLLLFLFTDTLKIFIAKLLKFLPLILLAVLLIYFFTKLFFQDWISTTLYTVTVIALLIYAFKKIRTNKIKENLEVHYKKGKGHFDISKSINITPDLKFYVEVKLRSPDQNFTIYYCFQSDSGKEYWLGYSHCKNTKYIQPNEHTYPIEPTKQGGKIYNIEDEVIATINQRFGENLNGKPTLIKTIRLRGSDEMPDPVKFSFKFF